MGFERGGGSSRGKAVGEREECQRRRGEVEREEVKRGGWVRRARGGGWERRAEEEVGRAG